MTGKYDDIIYMERPVSKKHVPMSMHDRAAQFAPFAALTGHKESIAETERLTTEKTELDENEKAELDYSLQFLLQSGRGTEFSMVCFEKDPLKAGGKYVEIRGEFRKLEKEEKRILLEDGRKVFLDDIYKIEVF